MPWQEMKFETAGPGIQMQWAAAKPPGRENALLKKMRKLPEGSLPITPYLVTGQPSETRRSLRIRDQKVPDALKGAKGDFQGARAIFAPQRRTVARFFRHRRH